MGGVSAGGVIYLIIGVVIASSNGYFADLATISHLISAVLAVALWPLILFGANLQISL